MKQIYVKSQLDRILLGLLGSLQLVDEWWHSSNKAFEGKAPIEVYHTNEQGKQDVASYILKFYDTQW